MYTEVKKHFVVPPAPQPFWIELTGTSYCDYTYRISRTLQAANVYVIEYILAGTGTLTVNSREYHPSAGDFYLLQPGAAHEYHSSADAPWTKIFANVYGPLCREIVDVYGLSNTVHIKNCDVRRPLQDFIDIANSVELKESEIMARCAAKFVEVIASAALHNNHMVYVNDTLYIQSSDQKGYPEQKDDFVYLGKILSDVTNYQGDGADGIPKEDFQANHPVVGGEVYQYGENIVVKINGSYWLDMKYGEPEINWNDLLTEQEKANLDPTYKG